MKVLTKGDLAHQLVQAGYSVSQATATTLIETLFDLISLHFQEGGRRVTIQGFGSFIRVQRKAYATSHPRTGEAITVPATDTVSFRPSDLFKNRLNNK